MNELRRQIRNLAELQAAVQRISRAGKQATTTWYASDQLADRWIGQGVLSILPSDNCVLIFRRDRDFEHIHHVAATPEKLSIALGICDQCVPMACVDLIGRSDGLRILTNTYANSGFTAYKSLLRMSRVAQPCQLDETADSDVSFATVPEAPLLLNFLENCLDRYAEQIPDIEDLATACAGNNILIIRDGSNLAGMIFFETAGLTTCLRYWFVDQRLRERGIGSRLIRTMFKLCGSSKRILLWVISENDGAIAKYERYGFVMEGLMDQIMIRKREHGKN